MLAISFHPIGTIHSPFHDPVGAPIQPVRDAGTEGSVHVLPQYSPALRDIDGFSHVILLYHFHRAGPFAPLVRPFLDSSPHGLFATRSPSRPNPIGLSVVQLIRLEGHILIVAGIDVVDGTPLLDIKPFVPAFDSPGDCRIGWLTERVSAAPDLLADGRFSDS
jgi:tRNA-Thr(GGU) m(6)t(6)A37 methyltransferase TsaA